MIRITGKKYQDEQVIATFEIKTDNPEEILKTINMLKSMGFQEISCN